MAFQATAYSPDEHCLLTIDGAELLAHDAQTESPKWRLTLAKPLLGVLFVDATALPGCQAANPFRSQSSSTGRAALVVDVEGRISVVDASLGQSIGELGPFGKPHAIASSATSSAVALAVEGGTVIVWRNGERTELSVQARALAFSTDGSTLAIGTDKEIRMFYIASQDAKAPLEQTFRSEHRCGAIADITQHPNGTWVVGAANGAFKVSASGISRVEKVNAGVVRLQLDSNGKRLAVQRSDKGIVIYEWPDLGVLMRIEYTDRPVRGISFGADNWLGVALDHGDGNKIDIITTTVHRTDTHPGRTHRSWTLMVEGKKEILSAKEAEDIRRMKSPFEPEKTASTGFGGAGGRIGIGAMISLALIGLRVCVRASSPSSSPSSFNYNIPTMPSRCDRACATERLQQVAGECLTAQPTCSEDAIAAQKAFAAGKCPEAQAALARIDTKEHIGKSALFGAYHLLATSGLNEACSSGSIREAVIKHAQVVHLKGATLDATVDKLTEAVSPAEGEMPRALYAAPDGTLFIATTTAPAVTQDQWAVYRRKKAATATGDASASLWEVVFKKNASSQVGRVALFGRSATDVYVGADSTLAHYDGTKWTDVPTPVDTIFSVNGSGSEIFISGTEGDSSSRRVHRRRGTAWLKESTPEELSVNDLFGGGGGTALWALAEDSESHDVLLQRPASTTTWTIKTITADAGAGDPTIRGGGGNGVAYVAPSRSLRSVWVSPTGDAFIAADESILHSANNGVTWKEHELEEPIQTVWGRSSTDVYAAAATGIVHWDGKTWSKTSYNGRVDVLGGTATELLVLRADE